METKFCFNYRVRAHFAWGDAKIKNKKYYNHQWRQDERECVYIASRKNKRKVERTNKRLSLSALSVQTQFLSFGYTLARSNNFFFFFNLSKIKKIYIKKKR